MYMLFFNMECLSRTQQYVLESMIDLWWHFSPPGQPPRPLFAIDELELIDLTQDLPEGGDLNERVVIDLTVESDHEDSAQPRYLVRPVPPSCQQKRPAAGPSRLGVLGSSGDLDFVRVPRKHGRDNTERIVDHAGISSVHGHTFNGMESYFSIAKITDEYPVVELGL
ncbi:hypothetical protein JB92DRAFT_3118384 [Gautieria morchelliformis]|nr:hypothetical protein JB92DRAFT_3118384 [Gautieria morchelliformis]